MGQGWDINSNFEKILDSKERKCWKWDLGEVPIPENKIATWTRVRTTGWKIMHSITSYEGISLTIEWKNKYSWWPEGSGFGQPCNCWCHLLMSQKVCGHERAQSCERHRAHCSQSLSCLPLDKGSVLLISDPEWENRIFTINTDILA